MKFQKYFFYENSKKGLKTPKICLKTLQIGFKTPKIGLKTLKIGLKLAKIGPKFKTLNKSIFLTAYLSIFYILSCYLSHYL